MAQLNCGACQSLMETDPSLALNGMTDSECTSLKNNTGLVTTSGNDDETDLNDMNDCLIGNLVSDLERYDICDWKDFMEKYMANGWTLNKALICAIAGLWAKVEALEEAQGE